MVLFKWELGLDLGGVDQGFDIVQAPGLLGDGSFTGLIDGPEGMAVDQSDQATVSNLSHGTTYNGTIINILNKANLYISYISFWHIYVLIEIHE